MSSFITLTTHIECVIPMFRNKETCLSILKIYIRKNKKSVRNLFSSILTFDNLKIVNFKFHKKTSFISVILSTNTRRMRISPAVHINAIGAPQRRDSS